MAIKNTNLKKLIKNTLRDNWQKSNVSTAKDPRFSTGWYDKGRDYPHVSVSNKRETSSDTYDFIQGDGSGPGKDVTEIVDVDIWVHRDAVSGSAKKVAEEMKNEVKRIIHNRYDSLSDFQQLSHRSITELTESGKNKPTIFRFNIPVQAKWFQTV